MSRARTTFNNSIELGTRAALLLTALDTSLTRENIVVLDYVMLYSKEFGGPSDLHPPMPNHVAEIALRAEKFPIALQLFTRRGIIDFRYTTNGECYLGSEKTLDFVSCLQSGYYRKAWERLDWINQNRDRLLELSITELTQSPNVH